MRRKVFLVGEGPNDVGDLARDPRYRKGAEGFLQPLLRRMAGEGCAIEFDGRKLASLFVSGGVGKIQRRKAAVAVDLAIEHGADALVLAMDADKTAGKRASPIEAKRRHEALIELIEKGFQDALGANESPPLITVKAVPCRTIEAWALGDARAVRAALGRAPGVPLPAAPEELWGKEEEPDSNHPKRVLDRVLQGKGPRPTYAEIASNSDPDELERICPLSFRPFATEVRAAVEACDRGAGKRVRR